jgi:hypothetical protein
MNRKSNRIIETRILKSVFIFANKIRDGIRNHIFIITEVANTFGFNGRISRGINEHKSTANEMNSFKRTGRLK